MFAGDGVEAGAGFVEDKEFGAGHQRAANEDALAFALGEVLPGAIGEREAFDALEDGAGGAAVGRSGGVPEIDHRVLAADNGFERGFAGGHEFVEGATDEADFFA